MTDRALSETAMLAGLRDIRLPVEAAGGSLAELAAAIALAAGAALIVLQLLRLFSQRRRAAPMWPDRQAMLSGLADDARRMALLHLLKDRAPDRFAELKNRLYAPENPLELEELETEVARLV